MANNEASHNDLAYAHTLWKAADALRGQVDAAEYKHIVLGLLFLKYVSDSFESRRDERPADTLLRDSTPTSRPTSSSATRRSTSATGAAGRRRTIPVGDSDARDQGSSD